MDKKNKGIAFMIAGLASYFIMPRIIHMLELYFLPHYLTTLIALILVIIGVINLLANKKSEENLVNNEKSNNFTSSEVIDNEANASLNTAEDKVIPSQSKVNSNSKNKIINVYLAGGIIGILGVSPHLALHKAIKNENANGWKVVQIIPASSGNLFLIILRYILLVCTLFFYTTTNGYYVIFEKNDN